MAKKKKILNDCPLQDKTCDDCDQRKNCEELAVKRGKTLWGKIKKFISGS